MASSMANLMEDDMDMDLKLFMFFCNINIYIYIYDVLNGFLSFLMKYEKGNP
jgi:hypothetical protein